MKSKIATIFLATILSLNFISKDLHAQKASDKIDKSYEWNGKIKNEILIITEFIDIKKSSSNMTIKLNGSVEKGTLKVDIFTPYGKKHPGINLVSNAESEEKKDDSKGVLDINIVDPINGKWKMEITLNKVIGKLSVNIEQE